MIDDIKIALELAEMELKAMYERNGYTGSNVLSQIQKAQELVKESDSLPCVSICLTKEEESKQIEAISSIIRGLARDNSTVAIGVATIRILNAFTRSINRC